MGRGDERRATILAAARGVFVRDGYPGAKLTDVAKAAGCSVGTLYTYFRDRDDLLEAVLHGAEEDMRNSRGVAPPGLSPAAAIAAANRAYLESYRRNARVMALLEQVSQVHPGFRAMRVRRARDFVGRNAAALRKLRDDGAIDPSVDVEMTAAALSAMVSRMAYAVWVDGQYPGGDAGAGDGAPGDGGMPGDDESMERVLAAVNRIWWSALGLAADGADESAENRELNHDSI